MQSENAENIENANAEMQKTHQRRVTVRGAEPSARLSEGLASRRGSRNGRFWGTPMMHVFARNAVFFRVLATIGTPQNRPLLPQPIPSPISALLTARAPSTVNNFMSSSSCSCSQRQTQGHVAPHLWDIVANNHHLRH